MFSTQIFHRMVVHIHNRERVYHLIRNVLRESTELNNGFFFNDALELPYGEFNNKYSKLCYMAPQTSIDDVTIYVNFDLEIFDHIINYVQNKELNLVEIYRKNYQTINDIDQLATVFQFTNLQSEIKKIIPTDEHIQRSINQYKSMFTYFINIIKMCSEQYGYKKYLSDKTLSSLIEQIDELFTPEFCSYLENQSKKQFHSGLSPLFKFFFGLIVQLYTTYIIDLLIRPTTESVVTSIISDERSGTETSVSDDEIDDIVEEALKTKAKID